MSCIGIEQLIDRVLEGDRDSFCELVMKYQHAVYNLAFHHLRNFADAEDVTQEVFLEAYRNLGTLKRPEMSGMELLQKIKQLFPYPQVIVMIVFATVDKVVKMMRLGAYDVIEKPFSPEKFTASIKQAIEKAKTT